MNLANEYKCQFRWRDWPTVFNALPPLDDMVVLDLGCGVGDQATELAARGARVIGYDANEALVRSAQARALPSAEFRVGDLREDLDLDVQVDGIWCSFTAAFFPDLSKALARWSNHLKPDGWLVVTEVDDLFNHEPLATETRVLLNAYAENALEAGRYDFRMGHKLEAHLRQAGFLVSKKLILADQELSFIGRGHPDVLEAWSNRFARMELLRQFCGEQAQTVEQEFMASLERDDHYSLAKVYCCIASKTRLL